MLQIANPYALAPVEAKVKQHAPTVDAWLKANPARKVVGLDELKAALPAIAGDLSRSVINQICADLNIAIANPEDREP